MNGPMAVYLRAPSRCQPARPANWLPRNVCEGRSFYQENTAFEEENLHYASLPKSQQNSWNHQFVRTSLQSRRAMGSSDSFSSFQFSSFDEVESSLKSGGILPMRPDQPECKYYLQTGDCKIGARCKFDHPRERIIRNLDCLLNPVGLPLRPGEPQCSFWSLQIWPAQIANSIIQ